MALNITEFYTQDLLPDSRPKILEYNVRFGDPETQVLLPLIKDDFVELLFACATNQKLPNKINLSSDKCMTKSEACQIFREITLQGETINLPKEIPLDTEIIHAGTGTYENNEILSCGGRVLNVTSKDLNILKAADKIYEVCKEIDYKGKYYRTDIAHREIKRYLDKN